MRRFAPFAFLLLAAALPARAGDAAEADCIPVSALIAGSAEPSLLQVAPGAGRTQFVKNATTPSSVLPGDPVIVTGERRGYACATFVGPLPNASVSSGWLPRSVLVVPPASARRAASDWLGDWQAGPERRIRIARTRDGRLWMHGEATFGASDPDRVKRGGVDTGAFAATVPSAPDRIAFLVGDKGQSLAYDARRARARSLCGLRLWRLGPYLVAADNLQCGGNGVTFTGIYRRADKPA
jgi:hypothetical protein